MNKVFLSILFLVLTISPVLAARKHVGVIIPKSAVTTPELETELVGFATELGKLVKENWYPQDYKGKLRTIVKVAYDAQDNFNVSVSETSGNASFDQSARAAVDRSIPNHFPHRNVSFEYVFNYKNTGFFSEIPVLSPIFRIPARIAAGYAADRLGLNEVIFIGI
jgi:hypothetical protein